MTEVAGPPTRSWLSTLLIARVAGLVLSHFTAIGKVELGYAILFMVWGSAYLTAWIVMHLLVPKFKQIQLNEA